MLHHKEVLHYLTNGSRSHGSVPKPSCLDPEEHFKMSEGSSDYVSLSTFVEVPRGAAPNPAKRVCGP